MITTEEEILIPTEEEFMTACNGRCKTRTFLTGEYEDFTNAIEAAKEAVDKGEGYYVESNAGGVARAYKWITTTARWGVYVEVIEGKLVVRYGFGRVTISAQCPRAFYGGKQAYIKHLKDNGITDYMVDI